MEEKLFEVECFFEATVCFRVKAKDKTEAEKLVRKHQFSIPTETGKEIGWTFGSLRAIEKVREIN